MIATLAVFAIADAILKVATVSLPLGQILILLGFGGTVIFASVLRAKGEPLFVKEIPPKPMRVRLICEILGKLFYTLAIAFTPLSSVTVILQAAPLVVIAGASLVFGEKVEWGDDQKFGEPPLELSSSSNREQINFRFFLGGLGYDRFCQTVFNRFLKHA